MSYIGKWVQEDKEGNFKLLQVLDVVNGTAICAGGKNIAVVELEKNYERQDQVMYDPFADPNLANEIDSSLVSQQAPGKSTATIDKPIEGDTVDVVEREVVSKQIEENLSPEEQFVATAIKMAKTDEPTVLKLELEIQLPVNIQQIVQATSIMGIEGAVVQKALAKTATGLDKEIIDNAISDAIGKALNTK